MEQIYVSKSEIIGMITKSTGFSKEDVGQIIESYENTLRDLLLNDCVFRVGSLGSFRFYRIKEQERRIQNFQTGEYTRKLIPAKSGVKFIVHQDIERAIKKKTTGDPYID